MYKIEPLNVDPTLTYEENVRAHAKKYPSLCVLPFIQLCTSNFGFVRMCNRSRNVPSSAEHGKVWVNDHENVQDLLNQDYLIQARQNKLKGQRLSDCERCYVEEDAGLISKRMRELFRFWEASRPALNEAIENGGRVSSDAIYLDLKLGNLCNLSCSYCCAPSSSALYSENLRMDQHGVLPEWQRSSMEETKKHFHRLKFSEANSFWQKLERLTPHLDTVFFEGGEPTLSAHVKKFMAHMIETGSSARIRLKFTTNMTHLDETWIALLGQFKQVSLFASIDGVGVIQEAARYGGKFEVIEKNFIRLVHTAPANIKIHLLPAITVMNAEHLAELFMWKENIDTENRVEIGINPVYQPQSLCIKILPDTVKQRVQDRVLGFLKTSKTKLMQKEFENELRAVLRFMWIPHKNETEARQELSDYLRGLKKVRRFDYEALFQHLAPNPNPNLNLNPNPNHRSDFDESNAKPLSVPPYTSFDKLAVARFESSAEAAQEWETPKSPAPYGFANPTDPEPFL